MKMVALGMVAVIVMAREDWKDEFNNASLRLAQLFKATAFKTILTSLSPKP